MTNFKKKQQQQQIAEMKINLTYSINDMNTFSCTILDDSLFMAHFASERIPLLQIFLFFVRIFLNRRKNHHNGKIAWLVGVFIIIIITLSKTGIHTLTPCALIVESFQSQNITAENRCDHTHTHTGNCDRKKERKQKL